MLVVLSAGLLTLDHLVARASPYWLNNVVAALSCSTVGTLIASRRPKNPIGWLIGAGGLLYAINAFAYEYGTYVLVTGRRSLPGETTAIWLASWLYVLSGNLVLYSFLLFPDGRLPSARWRIIAWPTAIGIVLSVAQYALAQGPLTAVPTNAPPVHNPFGVEDIGGALDAVGTATAPLLWATVLSPVAALILRFRRATGDERQQIKWVAYAAALLTAALVTVGVWPALEESFAGRVLFFVGFLAIPVAIGIAILKHRLYDIDLVVNRTLVYGALTAIVAGLYVLVVGGLTALLHTSNNLLLSLLAAGLVAVIFAPVRDWLQREVNRLMYGERDEPYRVLSRLGQRLEDTLAPDAVLPAIVLTIRDALKLPYAAIELKRGDESEIAASAGISIPYPLCLPLVYQGEEVGQLLLGPRAGGTFAPADRHLLTDLARQAGVAAHAVRLTAELQGSNESLKMARERLITAREEERRRLRRDLHDGLGPALAAESLKVGAIRKLLARDQAAADSLLVELANDIEATIADIRRLVYDLRPPALDDLGLVTALREHAAQYQGHVVAGGRRGDGGFQVEVEAPDRLPPLPAAVEVASYRIAQEALTNVARHAGARRCRVRLSLEQGCVCLEVTDDGRGLPVERKSGVGLFSMRERAEELGGTFTVEALPSGGTRILARFPRDEE